MPEAGQTTVDPPPPGGTAVRFNPLYFKTIPGIIKIVELSIGILCLILACPVYYTTGSGFFVFADVISFISTIIWIFVYLLSIREALQITIPWALTELINTGILAVVLAVGSIVQLARSWYGPHIAAGVFGLFNTLVYAAGAYLLFVEYRAPQAANGLT